MLGCTYQVVRHFLFPDITFAHCLEHICAGGGGGGSVANVGLVYTCIYRVGIIDYTVNIMLLVECHERTYCHGNQWGDV